MLFWVINAPVIKWPATQKVAHIATQTEIWTSGTLEVHLVGHVCMTRQCAKFLGLFLSISIANTFQTAVSLQLFIFRQYGSISFNLCYPSDVWLYVF